MNIKHVSTLHDELFCKPGAGDEWDQLFCDEGTYHSFIWALQRPVLEQLTRELARARPGLEYLDFACGSGRVLSALSPLVAKPTGIDISPDMAAIAAKKVPQAMVIVGDILDTPDIVGDHYDLITAFRFFLNTLPGIRVPILTSLAARLRDERSRLVFNIQGNAWSLEGIGSRLDARNTMSRFDVRALVDAAGLKIERWSGFGVCPACRERLRSFQPLARWIDRAASRTPVAKHVSRDLLFECRRK